MSALAGYHRPKRKAALEPAVTDPEPRYRFEFGRGLHLYLEMAASAVGFGTKTRSCGSGEVPAPTPDEIAARSAEIRAGWCASEELHRRVGTNRRIPFEVPGSRFGGRVE